MGLVALVGCACERGLLSVPPQGVGGMAGLAYFSRGMAGLGLIIGGTLDLYIIMSGWREWA